MFAEVQQDVRHGAPHLAWRAESTRVVAIGPDRPVPAGSPVDGLRRSDGQPPQSPSARGGRVRFGDHVNVVGLNGKMNDAE